MYKAIKFFVDLQDNNHPYNVGDVFPRKDKDVDETRIAELASSDNLRKEPLIALVEEKKPAKKAAAKKADK